MLRGNGIKKINRLGYNKKKYIYSAKNYKNPFFQSKKSPSAGRGRMSNKTKLAIFASVIAMAIIIWLLFFSALFKIQTIEISGIGGNLSGEVELIAKNVAEHRLIGKNNLLLYNKSELAKQLNEKYYLDNLAIKRKFFHILKINLSEKKQSAVWREDDEYYYIDGDGNIISQTDPLNINGKIFPLIENMTDVKIDGRKANIDKETVDYILNLFNEFKENKRNFEIERFIVGQDSNTVKMAVLSGPKIYFNIKSPMPEQTAKLDLIIKNKLSDNIKSAKEYIDLRYANNVYIK
ncbi:MAG: cell division protein FtsQ/DivIB [bacterium]